MKSAFLLLLALLASAAAATAQAPTFAWVNPILDLTDPNNTFVDLFDIQTDRASGQTAVFGYFQGRLDFDAQTALSTPPNSAAYFLAKYDTEGAVLWARKIGPVSDGGLPADTTGGGVEMDPAGNVYITGKFFGASLRFDGAHELKRNCPEDCADIFVAKYGPQGQFLWAKGISGAISGASFDADGVALAPDGDLFLSGNYSGDKVVYDLNQEFAGLRPEGFFLARLRPDGELRWIHFLNQEGFAVAEQLQVAVTGDVWVGGYYGNGSIDFGNNVILDVYGNPDLLEYFLVRYNAEGEAQEALNFNSTNPLFFMPEIAATPDTGLLIVHDFRFNLRQGAELLRQTAANAAMLTRYKSGAMSPAAFIGYTGSTLEPISTPIASVAVGSLGQFVTGGFFTSFSLTTPGGVLQNAGNCADIALLSGHPDSILRKGYRFGGGNGCEGIVNFYPGHSMRADAANHLYMCGLFAEGMNLGGVFQDGYGLFVAKMKGAISATAPEPPLLAAPLRVQPNPNSGAARVAFSQPDPEGIFVVYDAQGRAVFRASVQASPLDLHLALPPGAYVCAFFGKKGTERGKMLVAGE
jgi:hypothetical protein